MNVNTKFHKTMYARYYLLLWAAFLALSLTQLSPNRVLTGTVTDATSHQPLPGVSVSLKNTHTGTSTNANGQYRLTIPTSSTASLVFGLVGYAPLEAPISADSLLDVVLNPNQHSLQEVVVTGATRSKNDRGVLVPHTLREASRELKLIELPEAIAAEAPALAQPIPGQEAEEYKPLAEDGFRLVQQQPVTTFSADVDRAAYSNVRRMLNLG
jgi:Ca-activated chloride channel family protein